MNNTSNIIDNKNQKMWEYLKDNIEEGSKLSIVSAYFTIYAYYELKEKFDDIESLNFLFGEPSFIKNMDLDQMQSKEFTIEDNSTNITIKNRLKQKKVAKECAKWIEEKVNIKSMVKPNFLHGKMYHIEKPGRDPRAITGSSNFTYSGLGFKNSHNIELNVYLSDQRDVNESKKWFDSIWNDNTGLVEDVKYQVLEYLNKLYKDNSPEIVYLFTLYKIFEEYVENQEKYTQQEDFQETKIWNMLYDFQKDGVKAAISKIEKHNGCILADSVGLGKTFEALAVIKYYEMKNDRVLVLCPKRLYENWNTYKGTVKDNILLEDKFYYDIFFHTDLSRDKGRAANGYLLEEINWERYDLVVIDESHNFRNKRAVKNRVTRYEKLMNNIIKAGQNTKVLMLTATPINNDLSDLHNQINFITKENDQALKNQNIERISSVVKKAQRNFDKWADEKNKGSKIDLVEEMDSDFFKLLDEYTISRSRKHIKKYYDIKKIGKFPKRLKPISIYSELDTSNQVMNYEQLNNKILEMDLSIYYPSNFVRKLSQEEYAEKHDTIVKGGTGILSQADREQNLILMLKTNYLKRLESSVHSFRLTFERLAKKHENLINKIENYKENREEYKEIDLDLNKEEYSEEEMDLLIEGKINFNLKEMRASEWLEKIKRDYKVIKELLKEANKINREKDAKLKTLIKLIEDKIKNPINKDNKKILIFTAYADTANYLYLNLKEELSKKNLEFGLVTGTGPNNSTIGLKNFEEILQSFSPKSKGKINCKEEIDILVATDCISEGQNLQDCDYLINYDIHWNPVRITQRFGRIDRIGSKNQKIQLVNFWPEKDLEKYINLEKRVKNRMALSDMSGTGQENIIEVREDEDNYLDFREKQLKKLQNEIIDLEDMDDTISLTDFTLDNYKMDLTNYLEKNKNLKHLPEGIYSIVPLPKDIEYSEDSLPKNIKEFIKPGVIFCLKLKSSKKEKVEKRLEKFNPVAPYFLVYIYDNGEIKFNYTNLKQLLEIYKLLASGGKQPYEELEKIFTKETNDGENMEKYSNLLRTIVKQINKKLNHQSMRTLGMGAGRGQINLISKENQITDEEEFELISFLIIKEKENYDG